VAQTMHTHVSNVKKMIKGEKKRVLEKDKINHVEIILGIRI
jgi:hypothetical protein